MASPDVGLIKISTMWDAERPQANVGVRPGLQTGGRRRSRAKLGRGLAAAAAVVWEVVAGWVGGSVPAGSVVGMVATVCNGVGVISTQQMIGLALPAVLMIGAGLTTAATISATQAAGRGFQFGYQIGWSFGRLRSAGLRSREF